MKLVMTLLLRDEEDILGANLDYHLAQGVDMFIATDNLSVDGTTAILKAYEARGLLHYIHEARDDYNQHEWVTRMARLAHDTYDADWVINNDADEFWWPIGAPTLKDAFAALSQDVGLVNAARHNFVPVAREAGEPFYSRMVYRERISRNALGHPLPPKTAHRGSGTVVVAQGNHSASGIDLTQLAEGVIEILHYPMRSYSQFENKIRKGGAAYERNARLPSDAGITWRELYRDLVRDKDLHTHFRANFHGEDRLAAKLASGEVVLDERLANFFRRGSVNAAEASS
jgi:hypothetical protein